MKDVRLEYFKAPGPGGQHKNKTLTAVRAIHRPSGLTAVGQEFRSQSRNREIALQRLEAKLLRLMAPRKKRVATKVSRASQERRLEWKKRHGRTKELRRERVGEE